MNNLPLPPSRPWQKISIPPCPPKENGRAISSIGTADRAGEEEETGMDTPNRQENGHQSRGGDFRCRRWTGSRGGDFLWPVRGFGGEETVFIARAWAVNMKGC